MDESGDGQNMPPPLYGQVRSDLSAAHTHITSHQAVVTDDQGKLFTVGGTSGFTYFMDVHMLDFKLSPPKWSCLYR